MTDYPAVTTALDAAPDAEPELFGTATYSLSDDKIRIYTLARLPKEVYDRVHSLGFTNAPRQGFFFQTWTPGREDLALELCGDIEDEDTTPAERAAARSERFAVYSAHAGERAASIRSNVEQMTDGIPLGQPILVGHHSQKRAEKVAEKIENGLRRAVDEYKRADYWEYRAASVLAHAERRERPDVVFRRIKTLEAALRKHQREIKMSASSVSWVLSDFIHGNMGKSWGTDFVDLSDEEKTVATQYLKMVAANHKNHAERWIEHLQNRLVYERAVYADSAGVVADRKPLEVGGAVLEYDTWAKITKLNKRNGEIISVVTEPTATWRSRDVIRIDRIQGIKTKAEFEGEGITLADLSSLPAYIPPAEKPWKALENVKVEAVGNVPDLFPTPNEIIDLMFEAVPPVGVCLEPSAGTGAIVERLRKLMAHDGVTDLYFIEKDMRLVQALVDKGFEMAEEMCFDFMEYKEPIGLGKPGFDRIYMNPPFSNNQDVFHVCHAYELLAPGGAMVAIMSEHPFFATDKTSQQFRAWLALVAGGESEKLPEGSFTASGTGVNTRMVTIWNKKSIRATP